jgi:hypothetical protein
MRPGTCAGSVTPTGSKIADAVAWSATSSTRDRVIAHGTGLMRSAAISIDILDRNAALRAT